MIDMQPQHPLLPSLDAVAEDREKFFGEWLIEDDAGAEFDRRIEASGLFRSYAEVPGFYLAARVHREPKSARIDRILVPTPKLKAAGWSSTIGVEIKASGEKLGPALCQAIDYTYAAFDIGGTFVHPEMIFLWPLQKQVRAVKSVMVQNGIGEVFDTRAESLVFNSEHALIRVSRDGSVKTAPHVAAKKVGSR
jgi:hypothetical protein